MEIQGLALQQLVDEIGQGDLLLPLPLGSGVLVQNECAQIGHHWDDGRAVSGRALWVHLGRRFADFGDRLYLMLWGHTVPRSHDDMKK